MKALLISLSRKKYGGKVYEGIVKKTLSENFEFDEFNPNINYKNILKYPLFLWKIFKISRKEDFDFVIKDFESSLFLNKKTKNIAIIHHFGYSFAPVFMRVFSPIFTKFIFRNLRRFDAIVVVSKYWENYFRERGYRNVFLIYNGFDLNELNITDEDVEEFKEKYELTAKPIIYLGNCQKAKGVVESYQALRDLDYHLVTSGTPMLKIPAINLELEYKDYLKLLKSSSIVLTMSKFKEGWCRTAHEAMLCKTPVIGSGKGGMRELLEGGKQIICEDFGQLRKKVEYLLNHPEVRKKMGQDGYNFAREFTLEKFKKDWLELINKLI